MGRPCSICRHPQRPAIDAALSGGDAFRTVAERFGTSPTALFRHKAEHLPQALVTAQAVAEQAHAVDEAKQALDVVRQLRLINGATLAILREARETQAHDLALRAIARVERQIELQARLLGELSDAPTVNILVAPEWLGVRAAVLAALAPYPEARAAVAATLVAASA